MNLPIALSLDGLGVTTNAIGDYSGTPARFMVKTVEADLHPARLLIQINDADAQYNTYGNIAALTNGVLIQVERELTPGVYTFFQPLLAGIPIKQTLDWFTAGVFGVPIGDTTTGLTKGSQFVIPLPNDFVLLHAEKMVLTVYLNDDFSGLDNHQFQIQFD